MVSLTVSGAEEGKAGSEEVDGVPKTCWVDIVRMVLFNISLSSVLMILLGKAIEANQCRYDSRRRLTG